MRIFVRCLVGLFLAPVAVRAEDSCFLQTNPLPAMSLTCQAGQITALKISTAAPNVVELKCCTKSLPRICKQPACSDVNSQVGNLCKAAGQAGQLILANDGDGQCLCTC